jgi:predicted lipid-binding transport protein (Tim44 family)
MKKWLVGAMIGLVAASFAFDAEAQRRLGGGKTFGRQSQQLQQQRQMTPPQQSPQQAAPAQQANPAAATAGGAAAATRAASPWRGALMGLAAGLGIAALASWLGFGETLAAILTVVLLGLAIALVIGFVLRRLRGPQPAYGTAGAPAREQPIGYEAQPAPIARAAVEPATAARPGSAMDEFMRGAAAAPQPWGVPAGFDAEGFLANAKSYYGKLQAAWDKGDLDELAEFTTNEMFTALTHELRARGGGTSRTEILALDAALLGIETSATDHLASVRFTGTLRVDGEAEQVDEVWNLVKPVDGKTGWLLAGIQQLS